MGEAATHMHAQCATVVACITYYPKKKLNRNYVHFDWYLNCDLAIAAGLICIHAQAQGMHMCCISGNRIQCAYAVFLTILHNVLMLHFW